jgi:hypothetical protein
VPHPDNEHNLTTMSSAGSVSAGLKTGTSGSAGNRTGSGGGANATARIGPGSWSVKASQGSQRPNFIPDDIAAADRAHGRKEIRKNGNWI